ncbi:hypothetical protein ACFQZX_07340 [Mucilaginibacter litoreus]|uniref:Outer membrane protein beta-barrel domain-containing protein n=1 Tax=Mucilaginibacter litoreus TaxID=1048221 RepID=A0ABW3AQV6_9SPHI
MKRKLLIVTVLVTICRFSALAQDKRTSVYGVERRTNSFEIGAEYLMGQGDFGKIYKNGFGGAIRYRFAITEFKSLLASIGYTNFNGKVILPGNPEVDVSAGFIPVKIGMKFRFLKQVYFAWELGPTIALGVNGTDKINPYVAADYKINGVLFNFAPTLGVQIPTTNKNYIDLGFRYEGMVLKSDPKFFTGIRAAYAFDVAR